MRYGWMLILCFILSGCGIVSNFPILETHRDISISLAGYETLPPVGEKVYADLERLPAWLIQNIDLLVLSNQPLQPLLNIPHTDEAIGMASCTIFKCTLLLRLESENGIPRYHFDTLVHEALHTLETGRGTYYNASKDIAFETAIRADYEVWVTKQASSLFPLTQYLDDLRESFAVLATRFLLYPDIVVVQMPHTYDFFNQLFQEEDLTLFQTSQ